MNIMDSWNTLLQMIGKETTWCDKWTKKQGWSFPIQGTNFVCYVSLSHRVFAFQRKDFFASHPCSIVSNKSLVLCLLHHYPLLELKRNHFIQYLLESSQWKESYCFDPTFQVILLSIANKYTDESSFMTCEEVIKRIIMDGQLNERLNVTVGIDLVRANGFLLDYLDAKWKRHPTLLLEAIKEDYEARNSLLTQIFKQHQWIPDDTFLTQLFIYTPWNEYFTQFPEHIRNNRELILQAVKRDGFQLFDIRKSKWINDREIALAAVRSNRTILSHLPRMFQDDREFILAASVQK